MNLSDLKKLDVNSLTDLAQTMGVTDIERKPRKDLIFSILKVHARNGEDIFGDGVLEILPDGYGFLRSADCFYLSGPDDIYVSPAQIRKFHLQTGDTIQGKIRPPKSESERYFALLKIDTINDDPPESARNKVLFENLTPLHPDEMLRLERGNGSKEDITARIIDLIAPIGKGQRGLIVAPPKAGKTVLLQNIAQSITANHPECTLMVLLIDERLIEKAKRLAEHKHDVVILLDSITRLARAYNTETPSSGKVLTGGVDAYALQKPKRFFGAARNIEEGGSITIIATSLIDTGSKMDEVIYEEFKGTGNMELHLSRRIAEKRVYPAVDVNRSGTRHDELLQTPAELQKVWILRKFVHDMDEVEAAEFLIEHLSSTKTNEEFFDLMKSGKL